MEFSEFKDLWESEELIIVLDANALFDGYRFSSKVNSHIHKVLSVMKDNLWIPAQVYEEFQKGKDQERSKNFAMYKNATAKLHENVKSFESEVAVSLSEFEASAFPSIQTLNDSFAVSLKAMRQEIKEYKESIEAEITEHKRILDRNLPSNLVEEIRNLNQVGEPFNIEEKLNIFEEGEKRYKYKLPPGYEDVDKSTHPAQKYGDLVIWKEILRKAGQNAASFVFVTNDTKPDWWVLGKAAGKKPKPLRPRDELIQEFRLHSLPGSSIDFINNTDFINYVSILNNLHDVQYEIEMKAESIGEEALAELDWSLLLDESGDLTSYLIHSGDLQDKMGEILADIEVFDVTPIQIKKIQSVKIDGILAKITAIFEVEVEANLTIAHSKNYSEHKNGEISVVGQVVIDFEINFDKDAKKPFIEETVKGNVTGFHSVSNVSYYVPYDEDDQYEEYQLEQLDN